MVSRIFLIKEIYHFFTVKHVNSEVFLGRMWSGCTLCWDICSMKDRWPCFLEEWHSRDATAFRHHTLPRIQFALFSLITYFWTQGTFLPGTVRGHRDIKTWKPDQCLSESPCLGREEGLPGHDGSQSLFIYPFFVSGPTGNQNEGKGEKKFKSKGMGWHQWKTDFNKFLVDKNRQVGEWLTNYQTPSRALAEGAGTDGNQASLAQTPKGPQAQNGRCSDGWEEGMDLRTRWWMEGKYGRSQPTLLARPPYAGCFNPGSNASGAKLMRVKSFFSGHGCPTQESPSWFLPLKHSYWR